MEDIPTIDGHGADNGDESQSTTVRLGERVVVPWVAVDLELVEDLVVLVREVDGTVTHGLFDGRFDCGDDVVGYGEEADEVIVFEGYTADLA